ncbi:MAG TPA: hypothetical protein VN376_09600, partial [Longilinea sp.]|nr:hypothetical protein [Longilinea sp.]
MSLRVIISTVLIAGVFLVSACLPLQPVDNAPTATPTRTATVTTTIVWFPPTPTFTPAPTRNILPTPDQRPGVGDLIFSDNFEDDENWTLGRTASGVSAIGNNTINLAINVAQNSISSLRSEPTLSNFYLEITASPNLCRAGDAFGVIIRATSLYDFYRLLVNCNGEVKAERVRNGEVVLLHDWSPSAQIRPGASIPLRIGVWVAGSTFRFFIDDVYQFTFQDSVFPIGLVGVYARAAGDTSTSVNFSELLV